MDEQRTVGSEGRSTPPRGEPSGAQTSGAAMRARTWAIAASREPAAYGIPKLPTWRRVDDAAGLALAEDGRTEPFIVAEEPMTVRR